MQRGSKVLQGSLPVRASPELCGDTAWRGIISRGSPRRAGVDTVWACHCRGLMARLGCAKICATLSRSLLVAKQLIQPGSEKNYHYCFHVTCTQG